MIQGRQMRSPGEYVRSHMEAKGWTQSDLAFVLGMPPGSVNPILNDRRAISVNMARALAAAFDLDAAEINRVQATWDVTHAADPDPGISTRARIMSKYPVREMTRRGWIDLGRGTIEEQVCRFFGVGNLDEAPYMAHSAKKSNYDMITPEQLAWLHRVRQIAAEMTTPGYDEARLRKAIDAFAQLRASADGVRRVPRLLEAAGVRFVVVEGIASSAIDGVCFWLSPTAPVIGLSLRYDRIDNFWFVLRHECAHVLHRHSMDSAIIDCELEEGGSANHQSREEKIANEEAADFCVPKQQMDSFYLRKRPYFSETDVVSFAKRIGVHPGLVVGQLQRRTERYDFLRKHLVKVRDALAMAMMMDGWGNLVPTAR